VIRNESTSKILVSRARMIRGLFRQGFGLMFRRRLVDEGWVFLLSRPARVAVTNVFVFQTIDVLWLDASKRVLKKVTLPPFRIHSSGIKGTCFLLEMPQNSAQNVSVGDSISWHESKRI